ncbi:TPA: ead/Ea22-like family protein [Klebsiella pneumoniae]|nr:ead/Ea22-like family protein [Klebsiella pneumoniae]
MTTDITELAQSLKAAAEKATPGEWVYFPKNTSIEYDVGSDESQGSILYVDSGDFTQVQTDRNGEFIALANPANILALVEALEKAQKRNGELETYSKTAIEFREAARDENRHLKLELEIAEKRIAELESRTVKLPHRNLGHEKLFLLCPFPYYDAEDMEKALAAAGIKVEAE